MLKITQLGTLLLLACGCAHGNDKLLGVNKNSVKSSMFSTQPANTQSPTKSNSKRNKSAIALDLSKVFVESDGSFTPKTERTIDVLAALDSSIGAAVNFDLQFAKNSYVLTADGKQTLGLIADAISYMESDVRIDIELPKHPTRGKSFTKGRGEELVRLLRSRYGLKNPFKLFITPSNAGPKPRSSSAASKGTESKRVTVLNMGAIR